MAPRPYTWFFEPIPARRTLQGVHTLSSGLCLPVQFLITSAPVRGTPRHQRGHLTRPGADEITAYRRHVDAAM